MRNRKWGRLCTAWLRTGRLLWPRRYSTNEPFPVRRPSPTVYRPARKEHPEGDIPSHVRAATGDGEFPFWHPKDIHDFLFFHPKTDARDGQQGIAHLARTHAPDCCLSS